MFVRSTIHAVILAIFLRSLVAFPSADDDVVCLLQQHADTGFAIEDSSQKPASQIPYFHPACQPTVDRLVSELNEMQAAIKEAEKSIIDLERQKGRLQHQIDSKRGDEVIVKNLLEGLGYVAAGVGVSEVIGMMGLGGLGMMVPHFPVGMPFRQIVTPSEPFNPPRNPITNDPEPGMMSPDLGSKPRAGWIQADRPSMVPPPPSMVPPPPPPDLGGSDPTGGTPRRGKMPNPMHMSS